MTRKLTDEHKKKIGRGRKKAWAKRENLYSEQNMRWQLMFLNSKGRLWQ